MVGWLGLACWPLPAFPPGKAGEIMAGRLTIAPWPAVTFAPHRHGDIGWSLDPFDHPTREQTYQSGSWIEAVVERHLARAPEAYRARAKTDPARGTSTAGRRPSQVSGLVRPT